MVVAHTVIGDSCVYVHVTCDGVVLNKAMTVLKKKILNMEDDILLLLLLLQQKNGSSL